MHSDLNPMFSQMLQGQNIRNAVIIQCFTDMNSYEERCVKLIMKLFFLCASHVKPT